MLLASRVGDLPRVRELYAQGESLTAANNTGAQPIHAAALKGHLAVVKWLHAQGVLLTAAGNTGAQPIHDVRKCVGDVRKYRWRSPFEFDRKV